MFEIFLFINPIGIYCYDTERQICKAVNALGTDACYHYIPMVNVCSVKDDVIRRRKDAQKLPEISLFSKATYDALADYHAIKLTYGNKKARKYLYELQKKLSQDAAVYTPELRQRILNRLQIKNDEIQSIKNSDYLKSSIEEDQKLANQWNVRSTPTVIIFNENDDQNGILLEGPITENDLLNLLLPERSNCISQYLSKQHHLRLI